MIYENMLMNNCEKADISTKNDAGRNKPMLLEIFSLTHVQFFLSATHRFPFEFCLDWIWFSLIESTNTWYNFEIKSC